MNGNSCLPKNNFQHMPSKKTLDTQHNNKIAEFSDKSTKIHDLKQKYNEVQERIIDLENKKKLSGLSYSDYDRLIELIDERDNIKRYINSLENSNDEVDYLINTAPILFKYYDIIEKGNQNEDFNISSKINSNSILKFFVKKEHKEEAPKKEDNVDRATLLEKYLSYTDDNYIKYVENDMIDRCSSCSSNNINVLLNEGILYCNECNCVEYIIVDHDRPSYKDPPREISYFAYKRINHFNESINIDYYCIIFMNYFLIKFENLAPKKLFKALFT